MKSIVPMLAPLLAGCSGDGAGRPDAEVPPDAEWCPSSQALSGCNPVSQTGCAAGEKCTWQYHAEGYGQVACVPAGPIPLDGACDFVAPGPTGGYDDCAAGLFCGGGTCKSICMDAPDSCPLDTAQCVTYPGAFDCFGVGIGLCEPI